MNRKGNQLFRETEERVEVALLELLRTTELPRVTVRELCSRAHIHRTTFYGHYEDVYDLMRRVMGKQYLRMVDFFIAGDELSFGAGFERVFALIAEQKTKFQYYFTHYGYRGFGNGEIPELLWQKRTELTRRLGYSPEELYYHYTFFSAGLAALAERWLADGCQESPREMSEILRREYLPDRSVLSDGPLSLNRKRDVSGDDPGNVPF